MRSINFTRSKIIYKSEQLSVAIIIDVFPCTSANLSLWGEKKIGTGSGVSRPVLLALVPTGDINFQSNYEVGTTDYKVLIVAKI